LVAGGRAFIAHPDDDNRVFSLSEDHGPSRTDGVGLVVLLIGYVLLARFVWLRRRRLPRRIVILAFAAVLAGGGLLVPAIAYDLGPLWSLAVATMALPQVYLLLYAIGILEVPTLRRRAVCSGEANGRERGSRGIRTSGRDTSVNCRGRENRMP
jgi:hypothetical protein